MLVEGKWTDGLAAGAGDRREGRLRPPGFEVPQLGYARRRRRSDGDERLSRRERGATIFTSR